MMFLARLNELASINQEADYMRPWNWYTDAYLNTVAESIPVDSAGEMSEAVCRYELNDR